MRGHGGAADVDMRAAALGVGEGRADDLDGVAPLAGVGAGFGVLHVAHVVGVGRPMSQMPPRMSRATSRSPPAALRAGWPSRRAAISRWLRRRRARSWRRSSRCCRGAGRSGCRPCPSTWDRPVFIAEGFQLQVFSTYSTRSRSDRAYHLPSAPRRLAGMTDSSVSDLTGWVTPPSTGPAGCRCPRSSARRPATWRLRP